MDKRVDQQEAKEKKYMSEEYHQIDIINKYDHLK